jgi:hypothetical protein
MGVQTVTFSINAYGLHSDPPVLHVATGEDILWVAPDNSPMIIQCIDRTLFDHTEYRGSGSLSLTVRTNASPGVYRFASAVFVGGTVYMDARCPRLIID